MINERLTYVRGCLDLGRYVVTLGKSLGLDRDRFRTHGMSFELEGTISFV